jgi:hypothetical protein
MDDKIWGAPATAASTAGNDQAQSPKYVTAAAATTQPAKKAIKRWREPLSRSWSLIINVLIDSDSEDETPPSHKPTSGQEQFSVNMLTQC